MDSSVPTRASRLILPHKPPTAPQNSSPSIQQVLCSLLSSPTEITKPAEGSPEPPKAPIHTRLYMDSKYSKRSTNNKRPVSDVKPTVTSSINYGDILYKQNKAIQSSRWKNTAHLKTSLQQQLDKELTFHPNLPSKNTSTNTCSSGQISITKNFTRGSGAPLIVRELQECSFKPKINSQVQSSGNIHERLYLQATQKQKAEKRRVVEKSQPVVKDYEERTECVRRLLTSHLITQAKVRKNKMRMEGVDAETDRELFCPKTGRAPQGGLEKPVWDRLYVSKTPEPGEDVQDMYKTFRIAQYTKLFELIDKEKTGTVSKNQFSSVLDDQTLRLLLRLLPGKANDLEMDLKVFSDAIDSNINYLSMEERMCLLKGRISSEKTSCLSYPE